MQTQYSVLSYRIDLYFHKYKLAIEVDELGHSDRNINDEIERQRALERELSCVFIRINPDATDFNIFREINKIHRHIKQSNKAKLKEEQAKKRTRRWNKQIKTSISKTSISVENKVNDKKINNTVTAKYSS